jgi:tetratricopeptide (TPR) repeat protein
MATHRYHMASAMIYHDDAAAPKAIGVAREALTILRTHRQPGWEAATLEIIGYALWVDGQHAAALDALRQAETLTRRLGELAFVPELLAYQGLGHLGLGHTDEALQLTRQAVLLQTQGGVSDEVAPEILYARAMALATAGLEAEAEGYLNRAYGLLLQGAAVFEDEDARQAYFNRNPTMRRLMRELRAHGLAPPADAGVRRVQLPAQGGGSRSVLWTVDAGPPDAALRQAKGAVATRRARLAGLLAEAAAQGATPTIADLAHALEVSPRTVQRDMAALRR